MSIPATQPTDIQTKREALEDAISRLTILPGHDQPPWLDRRDNVRKAADAYGDARELRGHVEACEHGINKPSDFGDDVCGDAGFLCDRAKALGGK